MFILQWTVVGQSRRQQRVFASHGFQDGSKRGLIRYSYSIHYRTSHFIICFRRSNLNVRNTWLVVSWFVIACIVNAQMSLKYKKNCSTINRYYTTTIQQHTTIQQMPSHTGLIWGGWGFCGTPDHVFPIIGSCWLSGSVLRFSWHWRMSEVKCPRGHIFKGLGV